MFNNLEELKAEILQGKTNEEIIQERLAYLNSAEYKSKRLPTVKKYNTDIVVFYDGFIGINEQISFKEGDLWDILYQMDDITIYQKVIEYVRNNMQASGINVKFVMNSIQDYFKSNENSKYYELAEYLKGISSEPYFAREKMPYIINQYNNSNFDGSLKDFGIGYLHHWVDKTYNYDVSNIEELDEKYFKSVDWEKLEDAWDVVLPISAIKGAGVAACTEYSILTQNVLSFLGYDAYMIAGELTRGDKTEKHNFNIVKSSSGKYIIVDSAQRAKGHINNVASIDDIRNLPNLVINGRRGENLVELKYVLEKQIRTKTPLEQRNAELATLEAEAREFDKAEALKDKIEQQQGQSIGE